MIVKGYRLPAELARRISARAARESKTASEVVRDALEAYL